MGSPACYHFQSASGFIHQAVIKARNVSGLRIRSLDATWLVPTGRNKFPHPTIYFHFFYGIDYKPVQRFRLGGKQTPMPPNPQ